MKDNFLDCLKKVLVHEGGYVNDPQDPGGMTNLGVTKTVWEEWVGHPVDEKQMRALTPEIIAPLYKRKYWDVVRGDELVSGVDYCVFDFAVNSGTGRAIKMLQSVVGTVPDGGFGVITMGLVQKQDPKKLIQTYSEQRQLFLQGLKIFPRFGKGWTRRVSEVKETSLKMV